MTSSVLSVELVSVAYERMKDWPAHWSVLMRTPVIVIRVEVPLNDFLSIATVVTVPGFRYTLPWRNGPMPPVLAPPKPRAGVRAKLGAKVKPGLISSSSEMMPQPICSPASIDPRASLVLPPPVIFPVNVPATGYSRDVIAVVSGATGSCVSFSPTTSRCQPSGVSRTPGGPDGTAPSGGSGLVTFTGTAGSGAEADRPARGARRRPVSRRRRMPAWQSGSTWLSWRLSWSEYNGSVAREPLMVGLPNGEHTKNSSGPVPIEWASCDMRFVRTTEKCNRPHRIMKADGPQLDCGRWPVVHDLDT